MVADIERFMHDKMAATAVEYALIAGGLFAAVMVVAIRLAIRQHIKVLDARHGLASKLAALGSEWRHWPFMDRQEFRAMVCAAGGTYPLSKFLPSRILEGAHSADKSYSVGEFDTWELRPSFDPMHPAEVKAQAENQWGAPEHAWDE
jgi:Flp pilus assembly pilin Flp